MQALYRCVLKCHNDLSGGSRCRHRATLIFRHPAALPTDLLKRFARAVDRKRRMDGFPEVSCKGHLQHGRIEKRFHERYSRAIPEACAQIASTDVPVRPMNGSAIDR